MTISPLVINAFICSVKSYSEVGNRGYLVASDKRDCLLFGIWFRNPQKGTETRGKKFAMKNSFQVRAGPVKGLAKRTLVSDIART